MYLFEKRARKKGFRRIAGIDEAGRGPLAGPVVAACVVLSAPIPGVNDSKKLSEKIRERLFDKIMAGAEVGVGIISESIIDEINIYWASCLAMKQAFDNLPVKPDYVLVDGRMRLDISPPYESIVKGDQKSASVAAASIIAKVTRDRIMREYHKLYPQYEYERHKGYPTRRHRELIKIFGPSPIQRKTFRCEPVPS